VVSEPGGWAGGQRFGQAACKRNGRKWMNEGLVLILYNDTPKRYPQRSLSPEIPRLQ